MDVSGEAISAGATGGCEWTASGSGFAPLTGASSFSGSGTALFAISANTSTSARSTTVLVAGQSVVVNQAGAGEPGPDPGPQSPGEPVDTETVYFHTDAIGSVRMVTDASGAVLHRYDYSPDGALVSQEGSGVPWNRRSWAGKERDVETAAGATQPLDYFGARSYAQQLGRFTAVDPVLVIEDALGDPQKWNRYGYGLSNPLRFVDPDGRWVCGDDQSESDCRQFERGLFEATVRALSLGDRGLLKAVQAYGEKGDVNGVEILFGEAPGAGAGFDGLINQPNPSDRTHPVRFRSADTLTSGDGLELIAHEGHHLLQRFDVLAAGSRGHEHNLNLEDAEVDAYSVSRRMWSPGPVDVNQIRDFVRRRYPEAKGYHLYSWPPR